MNVERVGHLDVAPAAEAAVVVDRGAPLSRGRWSPSGRGRPGALLAAGDLDDQRAHDAVVAGLEPDEEVGDVAVAAPLVHVRDREAEVVVLHVRRRRSGVSSSSLGEELLPRVAVLAVEGDVARPRTSRSATIALAGRGSRRRRSSRSGSKRWIIGRSRSRRLPTCRTIAFADRLGGERLRLGDRHAGSPRL